MERVRSGGRPRRWRHPAAVRGAATSARRAGRSATAYPLSLRFLTRGRPHPQGWCKDAPILPVLWNERGCSPRGWRSVMETGEAAGLGPPRRSRRGRGWRRAAATSLAVVGTALLVPLGGRAGAATVPSLPPSGLTHHTPSPPAPHTPLHLPPTLTPHLPPLPPPYT